MHRKQWYQQLSQQHAKMHSTHFKSKPLLSPHSARSPRLSSSPSNSLRKPSNSKDYSPNHRRLLRPLTRSSHKNHKVHSRDNHHVNGSVTSRTHHSSRLSSSRQRYGPQTDPHHHQVQNKHHFGHTGQHATTNKPTNARASKRTKQVEYFRRTKPTAPLHEGPVINIKRLKRAFWRMDTDNSGKINREQLTHMLLREGLGRKEATEHVNGFFRIWDVDNANSLDFEMFIKEYIRMQNFRSLRRIQLAKSDKNGDGYIDRQELHAVLTDALGERAAEEQLDAIFRTIDKDRSGTITIDEMAAWYFQQADMLTMARRAQAHKYRRLHRGQAASMVTSRSHTDRTKASFEESRGLKNKSRPRSSNRQLNTSEIQAAVALPRLSKLNVPRLQRSFGRLDFHRTGQVSRDELMELLVAEHLDVDTVSDYVSEFFSSADVDGTGYAIFQRFLDRYGPVSALAEDKKKQGQDDNDGGGGDQNKFQSLVSQPAMKLSSGPFDPDQLSYEFQTADANRDGQVSKEELLSLREQRLLEQEVDQATTTTTNNKNNNYHHRGNDRNNQNEKVVEAFFDKADSNHDGAINLKEWMAQYQQSTVYNAKDSDGGIKNNNSNNNNSNNNNNNNNNSLNKSETTTNNNTTRNGRNFRERKSKKMVDSGPVPGRGLPSVRSGYAEPTIRKRSKPWPEEQPERDSLPWSEAELRQQQRRRLRQMDMTIANEIAEELLSTSRPDTVQQVLTSIVSTRVYISEPELISEAHRAIPNWPLGNIRTHLKTLVHNNIIRVRNKADQHGSRTKYYSYIQSRSDHNNNNNNKKKNSQRSSLNSKGGTRTSVHPSRVRVRI